MGSLLSSCYSILFLSLSMDLDGIKGYKVLVLVVVTIRFSLKTFCGSFCGCTAPLELVEVVVTER
jgi:hypothetical protein